ncbi:hypothetical protein AB6802_03140 [Mesorhizobium sp. RCC_202]|uniref:hypothetical protein n=1 Tax=Mesorhizobium sp. RCC_202 TaxID=3239222 RepID=UPI003525190C
MLDAAVDYRAIGRGMPILFEIYFYCCSRNVVIALLILLLFYLPMKERTPGKDLTTTAIILTPRNMPDVSLADAGLY